MLSYAFQALREAGFGSIAAEDFDNIHNLIAAILSKGISSQIKRGLNRDYEPWTENLSSLKGKIDISTSIKQQTLQQRRMVCIYDVFAENTLMNRILKTSSILLIRYGALKPDLRNELKQLMLYFHGVDRIDIHHINWSALKYHRNNASYKMLMNICYLLIHGLVLTTVTGEYRLAKYLDDQQMHRLFEKFVYGYYQREYPHFSTSAAHISWNTDDDMTQFLPTMKSDITLKSGNQTLIIDTKYYSRTMQIHPLYDKATVISGNLYQIFTYVKNEDRDHSGNVSGLLLYAKTDEDLTPDFEYRMSGNRISVKTLDLSADWDEIKSILDRVTLMLTAA